MAADRSLCELHQPGSRAVRGRHPGTGPPRRCPIPDGDGILNFDELFFGSDPLIPNTNRIIVPVLDQAVQQFKLQWQQAPNTFGLSSRVDWSSNLSSWTTNNLQIIPLGTVPNSTAKRFEARLSTTGQSNVFFRLLVE
jgi:hypothetical protein